MMGCKERREYKNSIVVPTFEIKIDLDKRAERELQARNETIKISLWLSGVPRKDADVGINKAMGIVLGFFEQELAREGVVRFEGLIISERLYNALEDKEYGVSCSVASGRKSSGSNLLNCEPFEKSISRMAGKQHIIECKLISDSNDRPLPARKE
ncbi:MAG: hypothetical protein EPN25_07485 [Nitrospirae bacterium]|nr:MAG: hypothetical protein EPN25_07485 [Nitrospirota bacterium]